MKILIWLHVLLLPCIGHASDVLPHQANIILPPDSTAQDATPANAVFICGITVPDVVEHNFTWFTPSGKAIEITSDEVAHQEGRYDVRILPFSIDMLINLTSFQMNELSYQDEGQYICSASYLTRSATEIITSNTTIDLQLIAEITPIAPQVTASAATEVGMHCTMARYLRPDSQFLWRKGSETISSGSRIAIQYSDLPGNLTGQLGTPTPARVSSLIISNSQLSDSGMYTCFVSGSSSAMAEVSLLVNGPPPTQETATDQISSSTAKPILTEPQSTVTFPISAVGGIAAFLGVVAVVLIVLIVVVYFRKRRKSSKVVLEAASRDLNDNRAYESSGTTSQSDRSYPSRAPPKYAVIDKHSISPAPPLPARPNTNLSMGNGNNSANLGMDQDRTPPGYDVPVRGSHSITIDPYYDNPDDVRKPPPALPARNKSYYDEVELDNSNGKASGFLEPKHDGSINMMGVPSPAVVLSGTLQRNMGHPPNPDFTYPPLSNSVQNDKEHDYDQIYSEPIDPNIIRQDYEFETNEGVPIPYSAIYEDPHPIQDSNSLLHVTYQNIVEIRELGMGQFGHVILSKTIGLSLKDLKLNENSTDTSKSILVAIKKLRTDADGCLMEAFEKEVKFMARLNHDNVIRLLGVCTSGESFIMMEYMENGDLNQFLTKQVLMPDTISGLQENEVTPIILLYIGVQIASGMHYLGSQRFVHRDLATRNCLVGRDFIVKISDFGMSRSLYESAYYRVQGTLVLPIRWMACETFYGKFSVKSDAWAFGVALWEIYTLGKVDPYDHMTDEDVIADAIKGQDRLILDRPESCPQDVYDIMQRCWVHEPSMRADFGEIYSRLFIIYTRQAL